MFRIFPQLKGTKISHSWTGTVAYTFDEMAHTGQYNGYITQWDIVVLVFQWRAI